MTIWIVQAEHPTVAGIKLAAFASRQGGDDQAADWTNLILKPQGHLAKASNWRLFWSRGEELVWIEEVELQP